MYQKTVLRELYNKRPCQIVGGLIHFLQPIMKVSSPASVSGPPHFKEHECFVWPTHDGEKRSYHFFVDERIPLLLFSSIVHFLGHAFLITVIPHVSLGINSRICFTTAHQFTIGHGRSSKLERIGTESSTMAFNILSYCVLQLSVHVIETVLLWSGCHVPHRTFGYITEQYDTRRYIKVHRGTGIAAWLSIHKT